MAHQAVEAADITKMASEGITGEIFGSTAELNQLSWLAENRFKDIPIKHCHAA